MKKKPTKIQLVKGYLSINGIELVDIVKFSGAGYKTVSGVLRGHGTSEPIRRAAIELLRFNNPKHARKVEAIWPEGERLAA